MTTYLYYHDLYYRHTDYKGWAADTHYRGVCENTRRYSFSGIMQGIQRWYDL